MPTQQNASGLTTILAQILEQIPNAELLRRGRVRQTQRTNTPGCLPNPEVGLSAERLVRSELKDLSHPDWWRIRSLRGAPVVPFPFLTRRTIFP
jgi:hypothetical protein